MELFPGQENTYCIFRTISSHIRMAVVIQHMIMYCFLFILTYPCWQPSFGPYSTGKETRIPLPYTGFVFSSGIIWRSFYLAMDLAKYFTCKCPSPFLFQLVQPFGDKSPMGLAWSFVGYSSAYSAFTGWGEIIGGGLLFFRRTTTFGALLSMVVIGNIVAINFCYDVPVKLYSSTLFIMSVFLAAPDLKRLLNVFILNKTTQPVIFKNFVHKRWQQIASQML